MERILRSCPHSNLSPHAGFPSVRVWFERAHRPGPEALGPEEIGELGVTAAGPHSGTGFARLELRIRLPESERQRWPSAAPLDTLPQGPGADMFPPDARIGKLPTDATIRTWTLRDWFGTACFDPQCAGLGPGVSGLGLGSLDRSRSEAPELGLVSPGQSRSLPDPGREPVCVVRVRPVLCGAVCHILCHGVVPHSGLSAFRCVVRCEVGEDPAKLTPHTVL